MPSTSNRPSGPADDMPPAWEQRLVTLEERVTYSEHQLEQFNELVIEQRREIDLLNRELTRSRADIQRLQDAGGEDLPHERPPHY